MTTYETATDQFITVGGTKYAYRVLGTASPSKIPLLMNVHFRGTMDHWDPFFINPLASQRPVLLIDNAGVGRSEGQIPDTFAGWAQCIISVVLALGHKEVDVLGFSMGGFVAQLIALDAAKSGLKVRKLIIAGSGPSAGPGVVDGDPQYVMRLITPKTNEEERTAFLSTFFTLSEKKQALGRQWWDRMVNARKDRSGYVGEEGTGRQVAAVMKWGGGEERESGSYDRLDNIIIPVLVANGSNDIIVPTENSIVLWKRLVNAEAHLHLYPDSGHGFLDEYPESFSKLVNDFLDQ